MQPIVVNREQLVRHLLPSLYPDFIKNTIQLKYPCTRAHGCVPRVIPGMNKQEAQHSVKHSPELLQNEDFAEAYHKVLENDKSAHPKVNMGESYQDLFQSHVKAQEERNARADDEGEDIDDEEDPTFPSAFLSAEEVVYSFVKEGFAKEKLKPLKLNKDEMTVSYED